MDPLLTSSMQLAAYKYETLLFELKSSATFWAIKRTQRTKIQKVINLEKSPKNLWAKYGPIAVKLLRGLWCFAIDLRELLISSHIFTLINWYSSYSSSWPTSMLPPSPSPNRGRYCEDSYTESLCCDSAFAHKKEFYIFKFLKRFSEISWRETSQFQSQLLCQS